MTALDPITSTDLVPLPLRSADDTISVMRRLRELSRISGGLAAFTNEASMLREIVLGLRRYFDAPCEIRIFLSDANPDVATCRGYSLDDSELTPLRFAGLDALAPMHRDLFLAPLRLPADDVRRGTILSAPLVEGTSLLGLLLVEGAPGIDLDPLELAPLAGIAAQCSMAVQHLRATGRLQLRKTLERDFEVAQKIQQSFLPQIPERIGRFRVAAQYRPAYHVGGDFYDVLPAADDQLLATIGDVSGKGISGALLMARVTSELRRISSHELDPSVVLRELDEALSSQIADDTFVTAACARLDAERGIVTVANAGHVLPLLRRASGEVVTFGNPSGPPLAMVTGQRWTNEDIAMAPGDILILMTDGVLDALHTDEDPLGLAALEALVRKMPPDIFDINRRILAEVASRSLEHSPAIDDITLLAVELLPSR
jgi:sigma-B regulation protein RsbU (phosphoserine phosphatase)